MAWKSKSANIDIKQAAKAFEGWERVFNDGYILVVRSGRKISIVQRE